MGGWLGGPEGPKRGLEGRGVLCSAHAAGRFWKIGGGAVILLVCSINMYFVVAYVMALNNVGLYVGAAILSIVYLAFVAYLVSGSCKIVELKGGWVGTVLIGWRAVGWLG